MAHKPKPAMKFPALVGIAIVVVARSARFRKGSRHPEGMDAVTFQQTYANRSVDGGAAIGAANDEVDSMAIDLVQGKVSIRQVVAEVAKGIDLADAEKSLAGKLRADVDSLLKFHAGSRANRSSGNQEPKEFSEESLAKARTYLNGMIEKSVGDLDKLVIECKEFQERNRETFGQVSNDIKRISSEISDLRRKQIGSSENIRELDRQNRLARRERRDIRNRCKQTALEKSADLKLKEDDLAVFDFLLAATKCGEESKGFVQLGTQNVSDISICRGEGELDLFFDDPKKQAALQKLLTPSSTKAIKRLLGKVAATHASFASLRSSYAEQFTSRINTTTVLLPTVTMPDLPVREAPAPGGQWKKCVNDKADCGVLHDTMSMEWGTYRDLVDELKYDIGQDKAECAHLKGNLGEQMAIIGESKTSAMEMLAETTAASQSDNQEKTEKSTEYHDLEGAFAKRVSECKASIEEILYTNICAVRKVRDELMSHSKETPPDAIDDCDVEDWVAGDCSVDCDDSCPQDDPYACGGWQTLERKVVSAPNEYGVQCPALQMQKKCNQFKCPVDCGMSEWSGWSACSADCEGGEQQRTRSILVKPANGGQECDTTLEARTCNTDSCDRDCTLNEWSPWGPCSMACGGGQQERVRTVLVPIRALGKCPGVTHADRLETRECNTQECVGDEICIAKQDLVIAVDGSGSVRESGFQVLQDFVANFTGRYRPMSFGAEAMRVGVLLFGNGKVHEDGTVSKATLVQALTGDMAKVKEKVLGLKWQKGITNMAQAFLLADRMFREGGRPDAQSSLMVITDGKPSFKFATGQQVDKLKEKNVHIYFVPVSEFPSKDFEVLKQWSTQPWETNYERIPGLTALQHNFDIFGQKIVSKFCPNSFSPSQEKQNIERQGWMLIHEYGYPDDDCGAPFELGTYPSLEECAAAAKEFQMMSFTYTRSGRREGTCWVESIVVTEELWEEWSANITDPQCPGGDWSPDPFSDTFAWHPDEVEPFNVAWTT